MISTATSPLRELRRWATMHPVAVVCLRRTRKVARVMHEVAANALFACADAVLLLDGDTSEADAPRVGPRRCAKADGDGFEKGRWSLHGDEIEVRISAERQNILAVLQDHDHSMNAKDIAEVIGVPACNVRQLLLQHAEGRRGDHALPRCLPISPNEKCR